MAVKSPRELQLEIEVTNLRAQLWAIKQDMALSPVEGCFDGACIVRTPHPGSVHTNGGCHCHEDGRLMRRTIHYLRRTIEFTRANMLDVQDALREANEELSKLGNAFYAAAPDACLAYHEKKKEPTPC